MQIGIRLHDVNAGLAPELQTLEARLAKAKAEGFSCAHIALSKVISGCTFNDCSLTEGLAMYVKRAFAKSDMDIAVLGCYMNLAHPDPGKLKGIQSLYYGHLRAAAIMGAGVVGTETGAPNAQYKMDANTHSEEALNIFLHGLEPVVECAEHWGVALAIEPVWKHIVYNADRAVQVLNAIASPNLRIILDPVNLLYPGNIDTRDKVIGDAIDKLGDRVAVVHLKDFVPRGNDLDSIAAGTGMMDYTEILRWMKGSKPFVQATLENTTNDNAEASRTYLERLYQQL